MTSNGVQCVLLRLLSKSQALVSLTMMSIIDNDGFLNSTLTGVGTTHRCNWMFLQRVQHRRIGVQENEVDIQDEHARVKDAKTLSRVLTEKASEMQEVTPYRTMKHGEPPIRPEPVTFSSSTEPQRKRNVTHALTRADINGDFPATGISMSALYVPCCHGW